MVANITFTHTHTHAQTDRQTDKWMDRQRKKKGKKETGWKEFADRAGISPVVLHVMAVEPKTNP